MFPNYHKKNQRNTKQKISYTPSEFKRKNGLVSLYICIVYIIFMYKISFLLFFKIVLCMYTYVFNAINGYVSPTE